MNEIIQKMITKLELDPHPEGGYFKEIYRSSQVISGELWTPNRDSNRNSATSIYFLLEGNQVSKWHQLKSDELWYFHTGCSVHLHMFDLDGKYLLKRLGIDIFGGDEPQIIIPKGYIFAAELQTKERSFALMGCMVSPGFEFSDFKMMTFQEMSSFCKDNKKLIEKFV